MEHLALASRSLALGLWHLNRALIKSLEVRHVVGKQVREKPLLILIQGGKSLEQGPEGGGDGVA